MKLTAAAVLILFAAAAPAATDALYPTGYDSGGTRRDASTAYSATVATGTSASLCATTASLVAAGARTEAYTAQVTANTGVANAATAQAAANAAQSTANTANVTAQNAITTAAQTAALAAQTHAAADIVSGNLAVARMPTGGTWSMQTTNGLTLSGFRDPIDYEELDAPDRTALTIAPATYTVADSSGTADAVQVRNAAGTYKLLGCDGFGVIRWYDGAGGATPTATLGPTGFAMTVGTIHVRGYTPTVTDYWAEAPQGSIVGDNLLANRDIHAERNLYGRKTVVGNAQTDWGIPSGGLGITSSAHNTDVANPTPDTTCSQAAIWTDDTGLRFDLNTAGAIQGAKSSVVGFKQPLYVAGDIVLSGTINAASLSGSIADARLSSNIPRLNADAVHTGDVVAPNFRGAGGISMGGLGAFNAVDTTGTIRARGGYVSPTGATPFTGTKSRVDWDTGNMIDYYEAGLLIYSEAAP